MNTLTLGAEYFASNHCREEVLTVPIYDTNFGGSRYKSIAPLTAPEIIMIPAQEGLDCLRMFTQGLVVLAAPEDICLRKAIELLEKPEDFEINLSLFKLDLTHDLVDLCAFDEADALINGIRALAEFLREYFTNFGLFIDKTLTYEFMHLAESGMLVMAKFMVFDGNTAQSKQSGVSEGSDQYKSCLAMLPVAA